MVEARAGEIAYHPNLNPARGSADEAARACVYLPPAPAQRILYLLHGVDENEYSWEIQGRVSALAEHLAQSDGMPLPLIVMPSGFVTQENKLQRRFPDRAEFDDYMLPLVGRLERLYESKGKLTAGSATAPSPASRWVESKRSNSVSRIRISSPPSEASAVPSRTAARVR